MTSESSIVQRIIRSSDYLGEYNIRQFSSLITKSGWYLCITSDQVLMKTSNEQFYNIHLGTKSGLLSRHHHEECLPSLLGYALGRQESKAEATWDLKFDCAIIVSFYGERKLNVRKHENTITPLKEKLSLGIYIPRASPIWPEGFIVFLPSWKGPTSITNYNSFYSEFAYPN